MLDQLSSQRLFRDRCYINGQWVGADNTHSVRNPANGELLGTVPWLSEKQVETSIAAAAMSWPAWRRWLPEARGKVLRRWADLMRDHREDLARIITLEQGKPLAESRGEVDYAASYFEWFAEEARRAYGDHIPPHLPNAKGFVMREPIGVCVAITPWNFPSAMITRKVGAALAAGCTMICRPANETPYSAFALAVLGAEAGVPDGVFNVITGDAQRLSTQLTQSTVVRKISFTGSTEVGRSLLRQSADTVKKVSMELGGHAPFIVTEHADLERAVRGCVAAKFTTAGQDCLGANRIYVHESLYKDFVAAFLSATSRLRLGNGLEEAVDIGPLMNERGLRKCQAHVEDALAKGAHLLCGGEPAAAVGKLYYKPTVLSEVTDAMDIVREETFGPVAPIMRFTRSEEVIARANDTIYGLIAYVYCERIADALALADRLEYGMVALNTPKVTGAPIPFGGMKQSGIGREGSRYGIDDYTELKYLCVGGLQ
jgi:succinate-semialdehyde dehydrogenase